MWSILTKLCKFSMWWKESSRKGRNPGLINLTMMVKVLARIKKVIRKMNQSLIKRRRKIRRTLNAIIVKSGGHYAYECRLKRVPRNKDEAHLSQDEGSDFDEVLLMETIKEEKEKNDEWYLDIRCSNHMTGKRSWFSELDDSVNRKIYVIPQFLTQVVTDMCRWTLHSYVVWPRLVSDFQWKIRQRGILKYLIFVPSRALLSLYFCFYLNFNFHLLFKFFN